MANITALGLMSGTSMDGIDLALVSSDGRDAVKRGRSGFVPYDKAFRGRLEAGLEAAKAIAGHDERPGDLAALEREITLRHARAVASFLSGLPLAERPALVGFHGQTVLHRPEAGLTVQLGDGGLLARETGLPVVHDMRANDMRHGGQGAPLVPAYHAALARSLPEPLAGRLPVVFVNVGGISNVTYVPQDGDPVAFDTGPGNALIDQWVSRHGDASFDADGAIASRGRVIGKLVDRYLANPFFARPGPKSLDRGDFSLADLGELGLADGARTLAAVSATAILRSVDHLPAPPRLWIICGGGRKNPHIVGDLRHGAAAAGSQVIVAEEAGLDGDATEAEAWAYLAIRSRQGLALTYPTTTGCRQAVSGGVLSRP